MAGVFDAEGAVEATAVDVGVPEAGRASGKRFLASETVVDETWSKAWLGFRGAAVVHAINSRHYAPVPHPLHRACMAQLPSARQMGACSAPASPATSSGASPLTHGVSSTTV